MRTSSLTRRVFQFSPSGSIRSVNRSPSKIMRCRIPSTKPCREAMASPCFPAMAATSWAFFSALKLW